MEKEIKNLKQNLLKQINEDFYNIIFEKLFIERHFQTNILKINEKDLKEFNFNYPFVKQKMIDNVVMDYLLKNQKNRIVGIEIKSYMDKIDDRLLKQLTAYHKICHHVVLFASLKHKKKIEKIKEEKQSFKEKLNKTIIIYLNDDLYIDELIKENINKDFEDFLIVENKNLLNKCLEQNLLKNNNFIIYEKFDENKNEDFLSILNKYCQFFTTTVSQEFLKQKETKEIIKKHFDGKNKSKNDILKLIPFDYLFRIVKKNKEYELKKDFDLNKNYDDLEKLNLFLTEIVCYFLINYLNYKNEIIKSLKEKPKKTIVF